MGITLKSIKESECSLCGAKGKLTGEHKIKASALRAEFGSEKLMIGGGINPAKMRLAQGPKSKEFHFRSKLCQPCNSVSTQSADLEFDQFHALVKDIVNEGNNPNDIFSGKIYNFGSKKYLDIFRYFAKILNCHIAETFDFRILSVSEFAIAARRRNSIWLTINTDNIYEELIDKYGQIQYAAHGGLTVYGNKKDGRPKAFQSTLTFGPVLYVFFHRLSWIEQLELMWLHREKYEWCRQGVLEASEGSKN